MRKLLKPTLGGYAKKKQIARPVDKPAKPPEPEKKPLPPGINKALSAMAALSRHLKTFVKVAYTVSIDVVNQEWVLVVRGYKPEFEYYLGYRVHYIKSQFIRNPMSK